MALFVCIQARAATPPIEILYDEGATSSVSSSWNMVLGGALLLVLVMSTTLIRRLLRQLQSSRRELRLAESRLHEAQDIARLGSWTRNFETGATFWSDEARKVLDLEGNADTFQHYERLVHPDDLDRVNEAIASAYYRGGSYQCDHRVVCPDGQEKYIRLAGQVFIGDGLSPVRETGTVQDITDRYLAERAVQRSEQRLKSILDATPYPIMILELGDLQHALYANRSTFDLFYLPEASTETLSLQNLWVEAAEHGNLINQVQREQRVVRQEVMVKDTRGRRFWAEVSAIRMDFSGVDAVFLLLMDISERKRTLQELERLATTDPLTAVYNRRSLLASAQRELRRSLRYQHPFTLMILDIDQFKQVNDQYGHGFGDEVIRRFSEVINGCLREEDLLGRLGGDEFCAILVSSAEAGGYLVAERVRKRWLEETFDVKGAAVSFTVSIGVASLISEQESVDDVLERADKGLYSAKRAGCNCVIVFTGESTAEKQQAKPG